MALAAVLAVAEANAYSLSRRLQRLPTPSLGGANAQAFDTFTPELVALAARGIDFPQASTTPGLVYRYNADIGMFERSTDLGSALLERANTVGAGVFTIGATYLYGDLVTNDGNEIEGSDDVKFAVFDNLQNTLDERAGTEKFNTFDLTVQVWSASATYGITDRWDVNLLVPVVLTTMDVDATVSSLISAPSGFSDQKFNVGDILLRSKYRFWDGDPFAMAAGITIRLPTGRKANFQGLGDGIIAPQFIGSRSFGPLSVYGNLAAEADVDDVDRSRFRYGLGAAYQIIEQMAAFVDFIGTSGISDSDIETTVNVNPGFPLTAGEVDAQLEDILGESFRVARLGDKFVITSTLEREDILDLAVGLKFALFGNFVGFATAIVPLNEQGVRARVLPMGGVSYNF